MKSDEQQRNVTFTEVDNATRIVYLLLLAMSHLTDMAVIFDGCAGRRIYPISEFFFSVMGFVVT